MENAALLIIDIQNIYFHLNEQSAYLNCINEFV